MSKKSCLISIAVVVIIVIIILACAGVCVLSSSVLSSADLGTIETAESEVIIEGGEDKIVVIDIEGTIMDVESETDLLGSSFAPATKIIDRLDTAAKDGNVKAIILSMDTPGGDVYASDIIYNKVIEIQEKNIKVVTLMKNTAASGGYYIAAPSDMIIASPITLTGSIGVRLDVQSLDGLYEKIGIDTRTMTNSGGDFKTGEGLFDDDPDGEEDQIYQEIIDELYDRFVNIVAEGRDMTKNEVIKIADGRVFTGKQAVEAGLVDQLGDFNDAVSIASEEAGISNPTVIRYSDYDFWSMFAGYIQDIANPTARILESIDTSPGVRARYLYEG